MVIHQNVVVWDQIYKNHRGSNHRWLRYSPSFQHSISSSDGWPVKEDHSDIRGYAKSLCDGIQEELGYSFGTYGVRLQQQLSG